MEPSKGISETVKLRETPKVEQYDSDTRKMSVEERVTAFANLPQIPIPNENTLELEDSHKVVVEIYKLTCTKSNKSYVGQAVSHIMNAKKYRRYGATVRFAKHVSETFCPSKQKKQCQYLNNAIRKYGVDSFVINVLAICEKHKADYYEDLCIRSCDTLYPKGYNLRTGGKRFQHTNESMTRVSIGVRKFFEPAKIKRFEDITLDKSINPESLLRILRRDDKQYGWYLLIKGKKVDFGGVREDLESSKQRALEFIKYLQNKEG